LSNVPPHLLGAVTAQGGAQLAVVIGAGCSVEQPTGMPLAGHLSKEAHRKLVNEGILNPGECPDPTDLAALATLIYQRTGSQQELVRHFPRDEMRTARANKGYLMLIALMVEGVISHVLSLNFDLAPQNAAVQLGEVVAVFDRPNTPIPMNKAVVHLHGSVNSGSEEWVLRAETITDEWKSRWQEVVARQILAAPNVLFVGLGSAAPVLSETIGMIAAAVGQKDFYQADIGDHANNQFAQQLNITSDRYIRGSWCEVMCKLAAHLAEEQVHTLVANGAAVLQENGATQDEVTAFRDIAHRLRGIPLLALGRFRANAHLSSGSRYLQRTRLDEECVALPLKTLAAITAGTGLTPIPAPTGLWRLQKGNQILAQILLATGQGARKMSALESSIRNLARSIAEETGMGPDIVLVGGTVPDVDLKNVSAPSDIVDGEGSAVDIIAGPRIPYILSVDSATAIEEAKEWLSAA
jgi:hypothetical protein